MTVIGYKGCGSQSKKVLLLVKNNYRKMSKQMKSQEKKPKREEKEEKLEEDEENCIYLSSSEFDSSEFDSSEVKQNK